MPDKTRKLPHSEVYPGKRKRRTGQSRICTFYIKNDIKLYQRRYISEAYIFLHLCKETKKRKVSKQTRVAPEKAGSPHRPVCNLNEEREELRTMAFPYFKISPPDYLNNCDYDRLTLEEIGAAFRLFMLMWQADMRLKNDDDYLARKLGTDIETWQRIKTKLVRIKIAVIDSAGDIINHDMHDKFQAAERYSQIMKSNRSKRDKHKK